MVHDDTTEEVVAFTARLPRALLDTLDEEAKRLSSSSGGVSVSRNEALRVTLVRALSEKHTRAQQAPKRKDARGLLVRYRSLYENGRIQHSDAARVCGCSEGTIRRWYQGGVLGPERGRVLDEFVLAIQQDMMRETRPEPRSAPTRAERG